MIDPSGLSAQKPGDEEMDLANKHAQNGKQVVKTGAMLTGTAINVLYVEPSYSLLSAGLLRIVGRTWQGTKYLLSAGKVYNNLGQEIYIGTKLARNIAKAGRGALKGAEAAHHVIPVNAKGAQEAREILARFKLNLDDPVNGIALPTNYHEAMHTKEYYRWVTREAKTWTKK